MTIRFFNEMRRRYYTTPSSYLELLQLYLSTLDKKRNEILTLRAKISNGLRVRSSTDDLSTRSLSFGIDPTEIVRDERECCSHEGGAHSFRAKVEGELRGGLEADESCGSATNRVRQGPDHSCRGRGSSQGTIIIENTCGLKN